MNFHRNDGSSFREITKSTQHGEFRLVSDKMTQKVIEAGLEPRRNLIMLGNGHTEIDHCLRHLYDCCIKVRALQIERLFFGRKLLGKQMGAPCPP